MSTNNVKFLVWGLFSKIVTKMVFLLEWPTFTGTCVDSENRQFDEWRWEPKENERSKVPCSECKAKCMTLQPCAGCECWQEDSLSLIRARSGADAAEMGGLFLKWGGGKSDSYPTQGFDQNGGMFTCHAKPRGNKYAIKCKNTGF